MFFTFLILWFILWCSIRLTCLHINDIDNIINDIYWVGQIVSHLLRSQELAWIPLEWNHDSHLLRRRTIGDNFVLRSEAIGLICTANRRLRSSLIFIGGQLLNCRTIELELIPGVKLSSILIVQSESTLQMTPQCPPVFTAFENDSSLMAARDFSNEVPVALYRNFKFICFIALSGAFWILFEVERKQISGSTSAVFLLRSSIHPLSSSMKGIEADDYSCRGLYPLQPWELCLLFYLFHWLVQVSSLLDRGWFHSELVHYCEISMEKYAFAVVVTSVLYRVLDGRSTPDFF